MNPKTKVYENGVLSTRFQKRSKKSGRFDSLKAKLRRAGLYTVRAVVIVTLAYATFVLGASVYSTDTITVANAETKIVQVETPTPINPHHGL